MWPRREFCAYSGHEMARNERVIEVRRESSEAIDQYGQIPTAFLVTSVLQPRVSDSAPSGYELVEHPVNLPYIKNYDAIHGNRPVDWPRQFDVSDWQIFSAFDADQRVGGAIAIANAAAGSAVTPYAELWDLRVDPAYRRQNVGSALLRSVELWATEQGCRTLRIETQHINVAACQFYQQQGCTLHSVKAGAYPELPDEIRLIWVKGVG